MKKYFLYIFLLFSVFFVIIFTLRFLSGEDNWLCQNGEWARHGNPSAPMPTSGCGAATTTDENPNNYSIKDDLIIVTSPKPNEELKSSVDIKGLARGAWYFEASFPVKLEDSDGKILAQAPAQAQGEWMTENYVPFSLKLDFDSGAAASGVLILEKDNPSGLPQNSNELRIPVRFIPVMTSVKVFFGNNASSAGSTSCESGFFVERSVVKTPAIGRAALEELLKGPTEEEKARGFYTSINEGVNINSLTIENGVAKVDFDAQMNKDVAGSCRVTAIRSQITNTLKQFPTVQNVIISVNGNTEEILQP